MSSDAFIVASAPMTTLIEAADRAALSDGKVLITGESGVGKDLIARRIHARSRRSAHTFVPVNCAGLTESLLESELFGHVRGSFTGAYRDKLGKLQTAADTASGCGYSRSVISVITPSVPSLPTIRRVRS